MIALIFVIPPRPKTKPSLLLLPEVVLPLHEHHPRPLPSKCLAWVETPPIIAAPVDGLILDPVLEEGNFPLFEWRKGVGLYPERLCVLDGFLKVAGFVGEKLVKFIPLEEGGVCLLEVGKKDLLHEIPKRCNKPLITHSSNINKYIELFTSNNDNPRMHLPLCSPP